MHSDREPTPNGTRVLVFDAHPDAGRSPCRRRSLVVPIPVEVDEVNSTELYDRIVAVPPGSHVVVDMAANRFIGSAGLRALVCADRHLRDAGGSLTLANVPPNAARVLDVTGLADVLAMA